MQGNVSLTKSNVKSTTPKNPDFSFDLQYNLLGSFIRNEMTLKHIRKFPSVLRERDTLIEFPKSEL